MEKREMRVIFRQVVSILICAAIAGFAINLVHPKGYVFVSRENNKMEKTISITAGEAYIKHIHGAAVFVDTRDDDVYQESHIKGAVNVPSFPEPLSIEKIGAMKQTLFSDKELVLYCDTGCDSAKEIAVRLYARGYVRHIYILKDGMGGWNDKGYPTE